MKIPLTYLVPILAVFSCTNPDKLTFEPVNMDGGQCPSCPEVSVSIPKAVEKAKINTTINNALEEEVISILTFDDEIEAFDIDGAIQSFKNGFLELKKMYPDETINWEAKIDATIAYEDKKKLTIELNSYLFTGGAHGYGTTSFMNFDKKKGVELENWELFKDNQDFLIFAEIKFRSQEKIPQGNPINSTGFMFENEGFYLPENIGFTEEGIQLHYNQYEVASYADGPIILTLPYDEVKKYLTLTTKS